MEETNKISVSQLFILLFLSRAFSLVAYSPAGKGGREDRKKYIDKIAAVFILQGYLDSRVLRNS